MKQEYDISKLKGITFSWKECEQRSGALLGYKLKLYYDEHVCTRRLFEGVNNYTILAEKNPEYRFPKAISLAAIKGIVGNHCPPVEISLRGQNYSEFAYTKSKETITCSGNCMHKPCCV